MLRRIKYKLLRWLLCEICVKSDCESCRLCYKAQIELKSTGDILEGPACREDDILMQATKVWGVKE